MKAANMTIGLPRDELEELFNELGELHELRAGVHKKVLAHDIKQAMKAKRISPSKMARRMRTSREAVYRLQPDGTAGKQRHRAKLRRAESRAGAFIVKKPEQPTRTEPRSASTTDATPDGTKSLLTETRPGLDGGVTPSSSAIAGQTLKDGIACATEEIISAPQVFTETAKDSSGNIVATLVINSASVSDGGVATQTITCAGQSPEPYVATCITQTPSPTCVPGACM